MTEKTDARTQSDVMDTIEQIREKTRGKRVVLIYPFSLSSGNTFLSAFLNQPDDSLLYYRINAGQTDIAKFLTGMVEEFESILSRPFGSTLKAILQRDPSAGNLGAALAEDLNAYAVSVNRSVMLYIDELDRLPMARDFDAFARALVEETDRRVQVAFNSRTLRQQPWLELVKAGKVVVLGAEQRKDDLLFNVEENPRPQVEIYAFGRGHALVNGRPISNWDGALPRNLFFFFVDRPLVTRSDIFQTFWPDLNVKEATNVFHVTKRKIAERISSQVDDGSNYELTQYLSGYYLPSDKVVRHYDVTDFTEAVTHADATEDERQKITLYQRAIDLYRAPFLQTLEMAWIQQRRAELAEMFSRALIEMGRIMRSRGQVLEALGFYTRALREAPDRDDVHKEVLKIYIERNDVDDARRHYEALAERNPSVAKDKEFKKLITQINATQPAE